jgi:anaerobic magnesium-protoporphyrin IX monomethyl ester cyclase
MKIAIGYPPLESPKGIPYLGQNRQFQWAHDPWHAYPMVPAYAATLLKEAGYQVAWLDGIASGQTLKEWLRELEKEKPDWVMIETKTPVIKRHWQIINDLKKLATRRWRLKIILVGDHVTALPKESFQKSEVDYVLTGGDYDFLLLNLANHLAKKEKLEPGIWFRQQNQIKNTGRFLLNHDLDSLPFVDRDLTRWKLYAYKNSNYSRVPGTYTMFGRDCWWGRCSFCSWTTLYPGTEYRVMSPKRALNEIGSILDHYPVREIMDDSGTFPTGDWLRQFCRGMIKRGYHQKIKMDCNMRFNSSVARQSRPHVGRVAAPAEGRSSATTNEESSSLCAGGEFNAGLSQKDYQLMGRAGFRFVLYGLESANQKTLDRLNKNLQVNQITPVARMAKKAGLWPHATAMVGYPWETKKEALKTLNLARELFRKGWIDTLQATVVIPYPGTPLFAECQKKDWLKTLDWDRYDMGEPVMKTPMSDEEIMGLVRGIYGSFRTPEFIWRKLREGLTSRERFKYFLWLALKYFSRGMDFRLRKHKDQTLSLKVLEFFWQIGKIPLGYLANLARR